MAKIWTEDVIAIIITEKKTAKSQQVLRKCETSLELAINNPENKTSKRPLVNVNRLSSSAPNSKNCTFICGLSRKETTR
jgi:hypothetical protein